MDAETLFTIDGGKLVALTQGPQIPRGIGSAISYNLDAFVADPGLTIGSWDQTVHDDRPATMSFTAGGTIVSVVVDNMDGDKVSLRDRISSIQAWLAPMQLRDLSQLFTEPGAFYEGLWDMSPNATIALQERRRYIVVTAGHDLESTLGLADDIGSLDLDVVELDVFTSESGDDPIIRWRPDRGRPLADPTGGPDAETGGLHFSAVASAAEAEEVVGESADSESLETADAEDSPIDPDVVEIDAEVVELDGADEPELDGTGEPEMDAADGPSIDPADESEIDLSESVVDLSPPPVVDISAGGDEPPPPADGTSSDSPPVVSGRTYAIETLPYLFDPDDEALDSISDEMFAVPGHLVLVDKLPERRRQPSPFENPSRYRWDADADQQTMLENNLMDHHGSRTIHLFVESDRQPGLATYVGVVATSADNKPGRYGASMWFDITPKVSAPLWQLFRKGRLPELGAQAELSSTS